jgi:putative transcriptional regulator
MPDSAASKDSINLTHHFLIAMPGLQDELFAKTVVYMCEHSERGALGLILNKPTDINLKGLFDKVDMPLGRKDLEASPVFQGGPVQTDRGFVLHEAFLTTDPSAQVESVNPEKQESIFASTLTIPGGLEMTTSRDVLEALSSGAGPRKVFVSLGYSSWGEGQLESEIKENSWLTVAADKALIFDTPVQERYAKALGLLGISEWMLSNEAGHA